MSLQEVAGPPRRDPLFLVLCLFALVIGDIAGRGTAFGIRVQQVLALGRDGYAAPGFDWIALGPLFGGLLAFLIGRHLGLVFGGLALLGGSALLLASPGSNLALGVFTLGHGLLFPCLLALAALWLPNEKGSARLALFCLLAMSAQVVGLTLSSVLQSDKAPFFIVSFAILALICTFGLATLDFWAGRGVDTKPREEEPPGKPQIEALALLVATGILAYAALGCAFRQQHAMLQELASQGQALSWLPAMSTALTLALLLVGILLALMGTFMRLPRLGVSVAIPFTLVMAAVTILFGNFLSASADPPIAMALFNAMAAGFLQLGLVPILSTIAGGVSPRYVPLALGLYLGLGGPVLGRMLGEEVARVGSGAIYPFAFLLISAAIAGHLLGRRADAALEVAEIRQ